ncbi:hypothetical protein OPV22_004868 [Ensete ventricosum]|uniref:Uncharacterized protein n=1 Tax=Ensete ventricosum TaxID=4639 RepID=A0AAV8PZR1_ENSVE|nr:hypothetical protein OPV22_004868 [Ensete ventricosum]
MCSEVWSAYALIESDPLRSPTATCILSNFKLSNDLKKRSLPVLSFPRLPPYPLAVPNEGGHRTLELGASSKVLKPAPLVGSSFGVVLELQHIPDSREGPLDRTPIPVCRIVATRSFFPAWSLHVAK